MLIAVGDQHRVLAKTIHYHIEKGAVEAELYIHCVTLEHLEHPVGVLVERFSRQLRAGKTSFLANANVGHPVYPVGCNTMTLGKGK